MNLLRLFPAGLLAMAMAMNQTRADPITFTSGERQSSLVELYTSEGCSSCPPAESWLTTQKKSAVLWKEFVPVAFHVDYWDYLGWRDRWSAREYSQRQRGYAAYWQSESVYTPGFVLDGREWRNWYGSKVVPAPSTEKVGILAITSSDTNQWHATFTPAHAASGGYEVHAALLGSGIDSDVKSGENRGRRLRHDFVVLTFISAPLEMRGGQAEGQWTLKAHAAIPAGEAAVAAWITKKDKLEPLQATGGWLPTK